MKEIYTVLDILPYQLVVTGFFFDFDISPGDSKKFIHFYLFITFFKLYP